MDETQAPASGVKGGELPPRDELAEWRHSVELRFGIGDRQFSRLRAEMKKNTEITSEIRDLVLMGKSFFKALARIGQFFAWCWSWIYKLLRVGGIVATAVLAIWAFLVALRSGAPPAPPGH